MSKRLLPEEKEISAYFRKLRDKLKQQISAYDDYELDTREATSAIKYQYGVLARIEEELEKVPLDEDLLMELEEFTEQEFEGKLAYTRIPTRTYDKLLNRLERLEAKVSRVSILEKLGKNARLLTQNITNQVQIEESKANTRRIELETHQATLMQLVKVFFLTLRKLGYSDEEIKKIAKEQKRLQKEYPLIQNDYDSLKRIFYAQPEELPAAIDAEYEEVDDRLAEANALLKKKPTRGRGK